MKIKDDFIDPMGNILGFENFLDKMFNHFRNNFGLLLEEEKKKRIRPQKEIIIKINNGPYFSKVHCNSYIM